MDKLETMLELLINEETDQARKVLRTWVIEDARKILRDLKEQDDEDDDDADDLEREIDIEEFFGESEDMDEDDDMDDDEASDMLAADLDDEMADDEMGDLEDDLDDGIDDRLDAVEDDVDDLEAEFEKLKDEFDEIQGNDSEDDLDDEDEDDLEESDDQDDESDIEEDEDFDDLEEGILDTLTPVKIDNAEAEAGAGKKLAVNKKSPLMQRPANKRDGATALNRKSSKTPSGFKRETAPDVKIATGSKNPRNSRKRSTDGIEDVSRIGNSTAKLNKPMGKGKGNVLSPIGSRGTRGGRK